MKTVEVSKEFVLEAHKNACDTWQRRIKEEFPSIFPKDKNLYTWYKDTLQPDSFVCLTLPGGGYGWWANCWAAHWYCISNDWVKATDHEVLRQFQKEAEKRGFLPGVRYQEPNHTRISTVGDKGVFGHHNTTQRTQHVTDGCGGTIFYAGKWSTVVNTMTKLEVEKKYNIVIKD